jgi:hypothetical protein
MRVAERGESVLECMHEAEHGDMGFGNWSRPYEDMIMVHDG